MLDAGIHMDRLGISLSRPSRLIINQHAQILICVAIFICALIVRSMDFSSPTTLMVDEVYYAPAANSLLNLHGDPNYVHPPLGKVLIAIGIALFGYNSFGWRIASVLSGSIIVPASYLIGRKVFDDLTGLLTSALLFFDPLQQVMSRIAMLDIFLALFVTLAFLALSYRHYYLTGVCLGLACGVKLSGAFAVAGVVAYLVCSGKAVKTLRMIPIIAVTFTLSLLPVMIPGGSSFITSILFSLNWHLTLQSPHPSASSPLGWLVNVVPFPIYSNAGQNISASVNPFIYPVSLPAAAYLAFDAFKKRTCQSQAIPFFWFTFVYGLFFILPRKTQFIFYLTPTIPAILLLASYGIIRVFSYLSK
jgi:predicted membrane-bound dolichyl-phosphate-mannose-protein mannosyltransferase